MPPIGYRIAFVDAIQHNPRIAGRVNIASLHGRLAASASKDYSLYAAHYAGLGAYESKRGSQTPRQWHLRRIEEDMGAVNVRVLFACNLEGTRGRS